MAISQKRYCKNKRKSRGQELEKQESETELKTGLGRTGGKNDRF